jgi:hypothetical protein
MENSRKLYELATSQLVTFLEQVSASLAATSSAASLRGSRANLDLLAEGHHHHHNHSVLSRESLLEARELGLATLHMARSQSMPGLALAAAAAAGTLPSLARRNLRFSSRCVQHIEVISPLQLTHLAPSPFLSVFIIIVPSASISSLIPLSFASLPSPLSLPSSSHPSYSPDLLP